MKILIVVDMQNDFINGCLGTPEAREIVPAVVDKEKHWLEEQIMHSFILRKSGPMKLKDGVIKMQQKKV